MQTLGSTEYVVRRRPLRHRVPVRTRCGATDAETKTDKINRPPSLRERSLRSAENARRRPKVLPRCENRATLAALHKTSQRGLLAYKCTYPVPVVSSQGHKLGNQVQPGVTAGAGRTSRRRVPRRCSRVRARKLTLRIETQRHPPQLANTVVESPTAGSTEKQGRVREKRKN